MQNGNESGMKNKRYDPMDDWEVSFDNGKTYISAKKAMKNPEKREVKLTLKMDKLDDCLSFGDTKTKIKGTHFEMAVLLTESILSDPVLKDVFIHAMKGRLGSYWAEVDLLACDGDDIGCEI